jgi:hypothetical protein
MFGNGQIGTTWPRHEVKLCSVLGFTVEGRWAEHSTIVIDGLTVADVEDQDQAVRDAGWQFSKFDAWTLFHREGRTVSVGLRDSMNPRQHFGVLVSKIVDPGVLAQLLDRYNTLVPSAWRGTPGTTALAALRLSWENTGSEPLWHTKRSAVGSACGPINWSRPLNQWEQDWGYVHTFDANSAYLAAAINVEVAWSALVETGAIARFDPKTPGYWLIRLAPATLELLADPARPTLIPAKRMLKGGLVWLTTDVVKLLIEWGDPADVIDSVTAVPKVVGKHVMREHARVFRPWGEALRDARYATHGQPKGLQRLLEGAVKRTYTDATGAMQRETMRVYRCDWADAFIDLAAVNLYRRIVQVHQTQGVWPVEVRTDSVSYADCAEEPAVLAKAIGVRPGLGGFKHQATVTTETWNADHAPKKARR